MAEIIDCHLGDDRNFTARCVVDRVDGLAKLIEVAEGFEDQQIDTGFEQRVDLLAESGARFGEGGGAERFDAPVQRPDGSGDEAPLAACAPCEIPPD